MMNLSKTMLTCLLICALLEAGAPGSAFPGIETARAESGYMNFLPLVLKDFDPGPGWVAGKVVNSSRLDTPISGALICFDGTTCVTTDAAGEYNLGPLPSGFQRLTATKDGFYPLTNGAVVTAGQSAILNFALSPNFFETNMRLRIVLTWDPTPSWAPLGTPNDLDAHLWLQATLPVHVYSDPAARGDCTNYPNACLEVDFTNGYGPESIAIRQLENATYYYGVLNYYNGYLGVPPLTQSSAVVQVYDEDGLLREYSVPSFGEGDFWYIFSMDGGGNISETNCLTNLPAEGEVPACPQ